MSKNIVSIILVTIFSLFLVAPAVIAIVDDTIDISVFYTSSEEEDKGIEKNKNLEVLFSEFNTTVSNFVIKKTKNNLRYYFKKYTKPHLNLISPPPELS